MRRDVIRYVRNYDTCRRCHASRLQTSGLLCPKPILKEVWKEITVDFVVSLPASRSMVTEQVVHNIMTVTDRLSKQVHLIATEKMDGPHCAMLFCHHVFKLHGLPDKVISDRGPQFTSAFWRTLCKRLDIQVHLSSAFHPQTDGQSERKNQTLEAYLRAYTGYLQDDWVDWLPLAEFAMNKPCCGLYRTDSFLRKHG